jgi:hypothetical protein
MRNNMITDNVIVWSMGSLFIQTHMIEKVEKDFLIWFGECYQFNTASKKSLYYRMIVFPFKSTIYF